MATEPAMIDRHHYVKKHILHLFLIIAIGIIAYSNTLRVPFYFDDARQIQQNPLVKKFQYILNPIQLKGREEYIDFKNRIVSYSTFIINYKLHGFRVEGYHIGNIFIHIINALLVYYLVIISFRTPLLCRSAIKGRSGLIALFSALIFAAHPVHTQAVTYIVQRLASLATMFYLLSLLFYIRWRLMSEQKPGSAIVQKPRGLKIISSTFPNFQLSETLFYCSSLVSAVLAMKSKEIAFTLPLIVMLYEFMFFRGNYRKRLIFMVPLLLTMLIIPFSLMAWERPSGVVNDIDWALSGRDEVSRTAYLITQFRVIATYLRLLVLPVNQNLDYDYPVYHTLFTPPVFLAFLLLSALFATGLYLVHRSRSSEPVFRLAAFGIFWFFLTLSVESSIVPLTLFFEHRLYLPSVGLFIAVTSAVFWAQQIPGRQTSVRSTVLLLSAIVVLLSGASYARNRLWTDPVAFWEDVVRKSPRIARSRSDLGTAYEKIGRDDDALREYKAALSLDPDYQEAKANLILFYIKGGRVDEALQFRETITPGVANSAMFHNYFSLAYFRKGLYEEAIEELRTAEKIDPGYAETYYNLGRLYSGQGRNEEAKKEFSRALSLSPDHVDAHYSLGIVYAGEGRYEEAKKEFQSLLVIDPFHYNAHYNLGNILAEEGDAGGAIREYEATAKLKPDFPDARSNLAGIYARQGRYKEALKELQIVVRMYPDNTDAQYNLKLIEDIMKGAGH